MIVFLSFKKKKYIYTDLKYEMSGVTVVLYIHLDRDIGISQFDIQKVRNHELKQSASQLNYH